MLEKGRKNKNGNEPAEIHIGASCNSWNQTALHLHRYSVDYNILSKNKLEKGSTVLSCQFEKGTKKER